MKSTSGRKARLLIFFAVTALGLCADLATKHWIFDRLGRPGERGVWWQIDGVFGLQTSLNQGALFGIGQGQIPLFVGLSALALAGVILWVWVDPGKSRYLAAVLGLISGGILGNLWDRTGLHGMEWTDFDAKVWSCTPEMVGQPIHAVRDWILVMIGDYPWPNFNIADSCLVCGAILIGIYALFTPASKLSPDSAAETTDGSEDAVVAEKSE